MIRELSRPTAYANTQAFLTDGANCKDTIFNDPRMTLGSYVKGPNNMICREWVWKGLPLGAGFRSGPGFMSDHTKMSLDCIAEPCINVV